jgi:hypothetical protein
MRIAYEKISGCTCQYEGKDGCYHCILTYGNQYNRRNLSRQRAEELFKKVVDQVELWEELDGLGQLTHTGVVESSELERWFVELMRKEAEKRRRDIEVQLAGSKYGVAYTDGTERITQLNRPAENNLMKQIEYLTSMLYGQLGITQGVFDGTADEQTMLNYYNRTIEPMISAITDEFKRKFLTQTARTQHQSITFFRDPFKLAPTSQIAEIADKFTRNEILTKNEVRAIIGYKPSDDPAADELRNANLNRQDAPPSQPVSDEEGLDGLFDSEMAVPTNDATAVDLE